MSPPKKPRFRSRQARNVDPVIYALHDPRKTTPCDGIRYVGQSIHGLSRAKDHTAKWFLARETNQHKLRWLKALLAAGLQPSASILEQTAAYKLDERERHWIKTLRAQGAKLTNLSLGGQDPGARGYKWNLASRERQSKAQQARFKKPEEHAAHRLRQQALWADPSFVAKVREARKNQFTPDVRVRIARALGGRAIQDQHGRVYATTAEAVRAHGLRRSSIQFVLRGVYKHTNGFIFTYAKESIK
jgi:hypothetical protein